MSLKTFAAAASASILALVATPLAAQPILGGPWSGLYVGGHVGGAFDANKLSFQDQSTAQDLSFNSNNDNTKLLGGLQLGYLFQPGGLVFGAEGDTSWAKNINYLSSVRGVLGVPVGPVLLYGTGGVAFEGAHEEFAVNSASGGVSDFRRSANKDGWTAGAGVRTFVAPGLSVGLEGLYYGLGRDTALLTTPASTGAEPFAVHDDRNFAVVRARVDYHFGW